MAKFDLFKEDYDDGYYHLGKDLEDYPDATIYVVFSGRGPGKTYSGLRYGLRNNQQIIYMKRTNDDVDIICNDSKTGLDLSPYVPLNRDFGLDIFGVGIAKGIGGFWLNREDVDKPPICYCFALNALKRVKGVEASNADIMIWDECVPTSGDVQVRRKEGKSEGEQCLDIYMTCNRDREARGKKEIKLVLLSNTEELTCPVYETLEIVDDITDMLAHGESKRYLADRGILIHHILPEEVPKAQMSRKSGIRRAMKGTKWEEAAFGGSFGTDFSLITREHNFKYNQCIMQINYKRKPFFIYYNPVDFSYYACSKPHTAKRHYDFEKDNNRLKFQVRELVTLKEAIMNGKFQAEKYTYYDVIMNFQKKFC